MKKKIQPIVMSLIMMLFIACSNEDVLPETKSKEIRTITLSASMPVDDPNTRVFLTHEEDNSITLTWMESDEIQLVFVQEDNVATSGVTVKNISDDKKKAQFDIILPTEIDETKSFDLYGVHNGEGLSETDPTKAILPAPSRKEVVPEGLTGAIGVYGRKSVMIYFASPGIDLSEPIPPVIFKHLGSIFSISVSNSSDNEYLISGGFYAGKLVGVGGSDNWAYNNPFETEGNVVKGGQIFDLVTGKFQNIDSGINYYYFKKDTPRSVPAGETGVLWGWFPSVPDIILPELRLEIVSQTGTLKATSANTMPARTSPTAAGKVYYFYANYDGSSLKFIDKPD